MDRGEARGGPPKCLSLVLPIDSSSCGGRWRALSLVSYHSFSRCGIGVSDHCEPRAPIASRRTSTTCRRGRFSTATSPCRHDSLGIEGFVIDGRTYMYFPPFPAMLRVPVLIVTDRFDGRLTTVSMLLAWIVLAVATATLFWNVRMLVRPEFSRESIRRSCCGDLHCLGDRRLGDRVRCRLAMGVPRGLHLGIGVRRCGPRRSRLNGPKAASGGWSSLTVACVVGAILTRTTTGWALAFTVIVGRRSHDASLSMDPTLWSSP